MNRSLYLFFRSYDSAPWRTESRGSSGSINKVDLSTPSKGVQLPERNHLDATIKFAAVIVRRQISSPIHVREILGEVSHAENGVGQLSKTHEDVCMNVYGVKGFCYRIYPAPTELIFNDRRVPLTCSTSISPWLKVAKRKKDDKAALNP